MPDTEISSAKKQTGQWLALFSSGLLYAIGLLVLAFCYMQYRAEGLEWKSWDLMLISGLLAFILALYLARTIPDRMAQTIERLGKRGVFDLSNSALAAFKSKMEDRARQFARIGAYAVGLIILVSFLAAYGGNIIYDIPLTILETFLGAVAGYYIGQMIAYGTLGQFSRSEKISIAAKPGYIDRVAGLKPIGDFYFFQAMVIAIPCIYLAVWWFVIPLFPHYLHWQNPYLGLLAIAMIFEILSFILPMWIFHRIMVEQKIKYLTEADELSKDIVNLEEKILHASDPKVASDLQKQLDFHRERYWAIEQMPTWPVDVQTRRKFTVNNLLLFLPFVYDAMKASAPWKKFLDILVKFLTTQ